MDIKETKKWLKLYEIAQKIQELKPWNYLEEEELLTYFCEKDKEAYYGSVIGTESSYHAIAIYEEKKVYSFLELVEHKYPYYILCHYQECMVCQFSDRQHVLPENKKRMKELGIKFRGTWISFENFERGYEPFPIQNSQVAKMLDVLENFYEMLQYLVEKNIKIDCNQDRYLIREYDQKTKKYNNRVDYLLIPEIPPYETLLAEDKFEKDMKKIPKTEIELEYQFLHYVPFLIKGNKEEGGRHYYPRARILADRNTGLILDFKLLNKNDYHNNKEYVVDCIDCLLTYFYKRGRPKRIYVRDEESKILLQDIAKKADIKLTVRPKLIAIDRMLTNFINENEK